MYAPLDFRFAAMEFLESDYVNSYAWCPTLVLIPCSLVPAFLQLVKQRHPGVLIIQLRQLTHDLAASFILQVWNHHLDRHNLVAALSGMRRALHASFAQTQFLPALRAR